MILLTLALVVTAAPTELKLAAPGMTTSGVDATLSGPLTDHLARAFTGVRVITPRDISVLLGLERQKALLGCSEDSNACMAELANALGVDGVLVGDVVKLGQSVQINVLIIEPVAGKELAAASERVESEDAIFDALTRVGTALSAQFLTAMGRPPAPAAAVSVGVSRGSRRFFPVPMAIGGAMLATGIVFLVLSEGSWQQLTAGRAHSLTVTAAQGIANDGKLFQILGATLTTVGVAAIATGAGLLLFGSADSSDPSARLGFGGSSVLVVGSF